MFFSPYFTEFLRQDSEIMSLLSNQIYFEKAPANTTGQYIVVLPDEEFDNGNVSVGSLTHKQSNLTILVVGTGTAALQAPWLKFLAVAQACRAETVESEDLGGSMFIQCVLPQNDGQYTNGVVMEGNELGSPCIVIPMKASYANPVLTP